METNPWTSWCNHRKAKMELDRPQAEEATNDIIKKALEWNPQGSRRVGRPRMTWRRTVEEECISQGKRWSDLNTLTAYWAGWKRFVEALCSLEELATKDERRKKKIYQFPFGISSFSNLNYIVVNRFAALDINQVRTKLTKFGCK